jgi:PTS system mannose-specific IIA component
MTHENIGQAMLQTVRRVLEMCPLQTRCLSVPFDSDPDEIQQEAAQMIRGLDKGDGVLILSDLFGSTPSNIAHRLSEPGKVMVVTGLNLPMMIKVMNYPNLDLTQLVDVAIEGGKKGVLYNRRS